MVDRSQAACRQILHRARARLSEGNRRFPCTYQQRLDLLQAFSRAAGDGDMEALTGLLAEDVVLVSDGGGKRNAALNPIFGRERLLRFVKGGQRAEPPDAVEILALNGQPALATYLEGELRTLFLVEPGQDGRIATLYAVRNPDKLREAERLGSAQTPSTSGPG
jgi:RNA polymerase sigma-70 factor (ECF subfamily)